MKPVHEHLSFVRDTDKLNPMIARLLLVLISFGLCTTAQAQQEAAPFVTDNQQLHDVLELQHQITLMKRLIERERLVNTMAEAGKKIGLAQPALSKPDRTLCAQLPANIPCAQAYDDLYDGFDVTPLPEMAAAPVAIDKPHHSAKKIITAAPALPTLYWLDIACLAQNCSALVSPDPADKKAQYRVHVGDTLPEGTVESISVSGVTLNKNGKIARIAPAPRMN